ncbi:MAG: isochorismatase family protein [bacterium]
MRHPTILTPDRTALLIVDIQPKLSRFIPRRDLVVGTVLRLITLASIYRLPVALTEQNVDKLGATEAPITEALHDPMLQVHMAARPLNKLEFSACASAAAEELVLTKLDRHQIILVGMETHICILQTALDLIANGRQVHLVTDGVGARGEENHLSGLARMEQAGCVLTNWESVCYEIATNAGDENFRRVLSEIMKANPRIPAVAG